MKDLLHIENAMSLWDWTARIECEKYELGQTYTVIIFLGEVPEDPMDWLICPQFVGAHHAIVDSSGGKRGPVLEEGFVHLSSAIAERSHLGSLEPGVVEPYLKKNLNWRVQKVSCFLINVNFRVEVTRNLEG